MNQRRRTIVRNGIWLGIVLILVAIIFISYGMINRRVNARRLPNRAENVTEAVDYKEMEENYQLSLTEVLAREGYPYSGITMTYVLDENGNREYCVRIHNRRLEESGDLRQQQILDAMSEVVFEGGSCLFYLV